MVTVFQNEPLDLSLFQSQVIEFQAQLEPQHGTVTLLGNNTSIRYVPNDSYIGQDKVSYKAIQADGAVYGSVFFMMTEQNEFVEVKTVEKDGSLEFVLFNEDIDVSGVAITREVESGNASYDPATRTLTYKPNGGFTGDDRLLFRASINGVEKHGKIFFIVTCECDDRSTVSGTVTDGLGGVGNVQVLEVGTENRTFTNNDGTYNIQVDPNASLEFSIDSHENQVVEVGERTLVDVRLARLILSFSGTVIDDQGTQLNGYNIDNATDSSIDTNGRFTLTALVGSTVTFSLSGYLAASLTIPSEESDNLEIVLTSRQVRVEIVVRDTFFNTVLAGVEVRQDTTDNFIITGGADVSNSITVPFTSQLVLSAPGFINSNGAIDIRQTNPDSDGVVIVNATMEAGSVIVAGRVTDFENAEGLENVNVAALSHTTEEEIGSGRTSSGGGYAIIDIPLYSRIRAEAINYQISETRYLIAELNSGRNIPPQINVLTIGIEAGNEISGVDFELQRATEVISGSVVDINGSPIEGALVISSIEEIRTNSEGNFDIDVVAGEDNVLRVEAENYETQAFDLIDLPVLTLRGLNIELNISARTLDFNIPVQDFQVAIVEEGRETVVRVRSTSNIIDINYSSRFRVFGPGFLGEDTFVSDLMINAQAASHQAVLASKEIRLRGDVSSDRAGSLNTSILRDGSEIGRSVEGTYDVGITAFDQISYAAENHQPSGPFALASRTANILDLDSLDIIGQDFEQPDEASRSLTLVSNIVSLFVDVFNEENRRVSNVTAVSDVETKTDSNGDFSILVLRGGSLTISAENYLSQMITIGSDETSRRITLQAERFTLPLEVRDNQFNRLLIGVDIVNQRTNEVIKQTTANTNLEFDVLDEFVFRAPGFVNEQFRGEDIRRNNLTRIDVSLSGIGVSLNGTIATDRPYSGQIGISIDGGIPQNQLIGSYGITVGPFSVVTVSASGFNSSSHSLLPRNTGSVDVTTSGIDTNNQAVHDFNLQSSVNIVPVRGFINRDPDLNEFDDNLLVTESTQFVQEAYGGVEFLDSNLTEYGVSNPGGDFDIQVPVGTSLRIRLPQSGIVLDTPFTISESRSNLMIFVTDRLAISPVNTIAEEPLINLVSTPSPSIESTTPPATPVEEIKKTEEVTPKKGRKTKTPTKKDSGNKTAPDSKS